nr:PepSY domain-containing protein [Mycolicibacterium palauense]
MSQTPLDDPRDETMPAPDTGTETGDRPQAGAWARVRPLLVRLHFYAGIFVGPFILLAAFTGLLYALVPQIDNLVNRHELTVERVGEQRLPLTEQIGAARRAHPEGAVTSIRPPAADNETTQVTLAVDDVPEDYARTVFVDPYTGEVRGALTTYGQWMPLRAWLDEFHRNLHLGAVGRNYSELAASWLWVVALAGLALWIGQRAGTGRLRRLFVPDRDATGRRRLLTWHGALGVWMIAGLLLLSVSGMTWSRWAGQSIDLVQSHLDQKPPAVDTTLPDTAPGAAGGADAHAHHHGGHDDARSGQDGAVLGEAQMLAGADTALHAAQRAHLVDPIWMYPPSEAGQGWQVSENKRSWPTRYDAISVDPDTGAVTDRVDFADWPFLAKLTDWIIGAHMGILFGVLNQILLVGTAVVLIAAILLGYRMWWRRRPTRDGAFVLPTGPRRGALGSLRPHEAVLAVLLLAGIGWFVPLFGLTLALFLAVDVALGWRAAKREGMSS